MSNKKTNGGEKFKSKIGGQALIEGIMMLGPDTGAMACRLPDGSIDVETWEEKNGKSAPWYRKVPLVRGCTNFVISLVKGYKYTMKSAEKQLTEEEKVRMCQIVTQAGADFIKTSTGFSTGGATFDDVRLFAQHVGSQVHIKAAGGLSSFDDAETFIRLGADRLGTSRLVKLAKEEQEA